MGTLNERSIKNLDGVHEDLVRVVMKAAEKADFLVTEGVRSQQRQLELVKAGKSQTKNSRHLYGLAVDVCDTDGCYDVPDMAHIAKAMKLAALELGIPIVWGGDWKTFKDTPHFELDRKSYPDNGARKPWVMKPGTLTKTAAAGAVATAVNQAAPYIPAPSVPQIDFAGIAEILRVVGPALNTPATLVFVGLAVLYWWGVPKLFGGST